MWVSITLQGACSLRAARALRRLNAVSLKLVGMSMVPLFQTSEIFWASSIVILAADPFSWASGTVPITRSFVPSAGVGIVAGWAPPFTQSGFGTRSYVTPGATSPVLSRWNSSFRLGRESAMPLSARTWRQRRAAIEDWIALMRLSWGAV